MEKMSNLKYDALDLMIVEALGKFGPRNVYRIAKYLDLPESTIRYRINVLRSMKLLYLHTNIYHTNIGLKKGVVFLEADPRYSAYIYDFLACNDYWLLIRRTHSYSEGCWALYTIPVNHTDKLRDFFDEIKSLGLVWSYKLYWSTCFHRVNTTTTWFDLSNEKWDFRWEKLLSDVERAGTDLPFTLKDPKDFPILCDEIDLFILKELEKDATISFAEIAKKLGVTTQNVCYHYKQHIIKNSLIEDFQIGFIKFDPKVSVTPIFIIEFPKYEYLAKMANALCDKPFVEILGKILNKNMLLLIAYLPIYEFFNMLNTFNRMAELGYIKRYKYYLRSFMEKGIRQTIPYRNFKDGTWVYDHELYISRLHEAFKDVSKKLRDDS